RVMCEAGGIEIAPEFAIDALEYVEIEVACQALAIAVGPRQYLGILLEVETHQQQVVMVQVLPECAQKTQGIFVVEVANVGSEKQREFARGRGMFQMPQAVHIFADYSLGV